MRWPLKYQIMAPMTVIMLGTILAVSILQAYTAAQQMRQRTATRLRHVTSTLASSPGFSLKGSVLQQMKGLAGAEFVLLDRQGHVQGTTRDDWRDDDLSELPTQDLSPGFLVQPVTLAGSHWYHGSVAVRPRGPGQHDLRLHVFYPEDVYLRERRAAMYPALVIGSLAIVLVVLLAQFTASRVSRPLDQLRQQVHAISQGQFHSMALPARDDEVRDLTAAVNHMTETLQRYEQQVRRAEQNRLLAQLGGGLAHQLRNAATGARMALDIHRDECAAEGQSESLEVAARQLALIEQYLSRFLSWGAAPEPARFERVELGGLVRELLPLVQPAARHMGVALGVQLPAHPIELSGDRVTLGHLVMNLLTNAIEAAGQKAGSSAPGSVAPRVQLSARGTPTGRIILAVEDTGAGPPAALRETLFDPLITSKKDGVGLGLAVVREVARDHHGEVRWERVTPDDSSTAMTRFIVDLPMSGEGTARADSAGC